VQALGGAKEPCVVFAGRRLEFAANALIGAAYGSAGERCMAVSAVVAVGRRGSSTGEVDCRKGQGRQIGRAIRTAFDMGPLITASTETEWLVL